MIVEKKLKGKWCHLIEPVILSERDIEYYNLYSGHFTMSDVETLCQILVHPHKEIFTEKNIREFDYGCVSLRNEEYFIPSYRVKDILYSIKEGIYTQEEVLLDTCKMLRKNDQLREKCYEYLLRVGYVKEMK